MSPQVRDPQAQIGHLREMNPMRKALSSVENVRDFFIKSDNILYCGTLQEENAAIIHAIRLFG